MLFLLRDREGKALMIAEAESKADADAFGQANVPQFSGECLELDCRNCTEAEQLWGVLTVLVPPAAATARKPAFVITQVWVRGLELPEEVEQDDVLTPEDRRDLALDHIARTSSFIGRVEIRKWARRQTVR